MMPELDGYQTLQILRENPKTAGIPIIFVTAKSKKSDLRRGMNLGADDYLTKPFEEHELLEAIESRLKKNDLMKKTFSKMNMDTESFLIDASQFMDLEGFTQKYPIKTYEIGTTILSEGKNASKLYFIQSGVVKTHKLTATGKEFITGIHGSGNFVGQVSLLNEKEVNIETATVIEEAIMCEIPKNDFKQLMYKNNVVANKFIMILSKDLIDSRKQMLYMAFAPVRQRVAKALLELHSNSNVHIGTNTLGVDIPREDFAGIIGTATETAIRMLSKFKEEGLITTGKGRKIILLDIDKLRRIASFA
ncbi:cyclic nucleotide-binding domain-containing protein [Aquimarina sp. 2-A2]|uniref:cyclic nucleotide-binding domain-containing protein n=1 Tax=Aquimarina sp. 2-A2 TaxID=3382644 RepID=UPI00387F1161